jgi:hypothetical protein
LRLCNSKKPAINNWEVTVCNQVDGTNTCELKSWTKLDSLVDNLLSTYAGLPEAL